MDEDPIWRNEIMGTFPEPSPEYREAHTLWAVAHAILEERDAGVCRQRNDQGEAVPTTPWEYSMIQMTARRMYAVLREQAQRFPGGVWASARKDAERLHFRDCLHIKEQHPDVERLRLIALARQH